MEKKRRHDGIFGTPPEPIFNTHPMCLSREMLTDWLKVLTAQNSTAIQTAAQTVQVSHGCYKTGIAAEYVFSTCQQLKLTYDARYLALELLDKFMTQHVAYLHAHVRDMKRPGRRLEWKTIMQRVQKQLPLRVLSCCQLASKLTSHYRMLGSRRATETLRSLGHRFSATSILQSELRILKALEYRVLLPTPLTFTEILIQILANDNTDLEVAVYHDVTLKLLDVLYIRLHVIYRRLYVVATHRDPDSPKDRRKLAQLQCDLLLQGVAVVAAAGYIIDRNKTNKCVDTLSAVTHIPSEDILDLSTILIQQIVEE